MGPGALRRKPSVRKLTVKPAQLLPYIIFVIGLACNHMLFRLSPKSAALVTLSDPTFAGCAVDMLKTARTVGKWRLPMVLMAIDYNRFGREQVSALNEMNVIVIPTQPIFDEWLTRPFGNVWVYRELQQAKFRKMQLFLSPFLRQFERLVFLDADGMVGGSLEPMLAVKFPENVSILMRENGSAYGKRSFWENEVYTKLYDQRTLKHLTEKFPNRSLSGSSAYFVVDTRDMASPIEILKRSLQILCEFRPGFRFNDQTLISLLFYDKISLFPHCALSELPVLNGMEELKEYCIWKEDNLNDHDQIYYHMEVPEKKRKCVLSSEERHNEGIPDFSGELGKVTEFKPRHGVRCMRSLREWRKWVEEHP